MRVAYFSGHVIRPGTVIQLDYISEEYKFEVLEVEEDSFLVRWLAGTSEGHEDRLPFSIMGGKVSTVEEQEDTLDPNRAFRMQKGGW
jgi:hypothetical protein